MLLRWPTSILALLAAALPAGSFALGLGDIHADAVLGRPLSAQIELLGVAASDLPKVRASIADAANFQRRGLNRPAILSAVAVTVAQDTQGHAILLLHSDDTYAEPMLTFLVDLHAPDGELIREYTLLFDPPSTPTDTSAIARTAITTHSITATPVASPVPAPTSAASTDSTASAAPSASAGQRTGAPRSYTIARYDTLARIAARFSPQHSSPAQRQRMMIALYRNNRPAFGRNINRLHVGAKLSIPDAAQLARISAAEARREIAEQKAGWRRSPQPSASITRQATAATPAPTGDDRESLAATAASVAALTTHIHALEASIDQLQQKLNQSVTAAAAPTPTPNTDRSARTEAPVPPRHGIGKTAGLAAALSLLAGGIWWIRQRRASPVARPSSWSLADGPVAAAAIANASPTAVTIPTLQTPATAREAVHSTSRNEFTSELSTDALLSASRFLKEAQMETEHRPHDADTSTDDEPMFDRTVVYSLPPEHPANPAAAEEIDATDIITAVLRSPPETAGDTVEQPRYNPEATQNTTHVMIPSGLHEPEPFRERRKNPVDVLRQAIDKEPGRTDLRLKLLELYYTAAAQNRRAFLDYAQQLVDSDRLSPSQWKQIVEMGRHIAPLDKMFADEGDDQAVA